MDIFNTRKINIDKINLIKNALQYIGGSALYFFIFNEFSVLKFFLGLIGFLIAYHSVYRFNDIMDYKEDRKDNMRKQYKPLVTGKIKINNVVSQMFLFLIIGLPLCFFVSNLFGFLVLVTLFLNFLHSSNLIRLKKSRYLLIPNLFFIESIKYSLGWFSLTFSLERFPYFFMFFLSSSYVVAYFYYKQNVSNFFGNLKIKILSIISIVFYIVSLFIYPFKIAIILPFPLLFIYLIFKNRSSLEKFKMYVNIAFVGGTIFIILMLILPFPSIAELNNEISTKIDFVKDNITEMMPDYLKTNIEEIQEKIYKINVDATVFVNNIT